MTKYPHGLTLNAVCAAIDDYQRHEDSVPEEGILAAFNTLLGHSDIADALRSMERTADVNMAAAQAMRDDMYHWKQRAEEAEAKLAELEKQRNPDYFLNRIESSDKWGPEVELRIYESQLDASKSQDDHGGGIIELFTHPAPAADLSAMVPPGWKLVPVEPTPEMLDEIWLDERFKEMAMKRRYYALLAAAPAPPE